MPPISKKRLSHTFLGHYHELMAVFHRTAAHKLPGSKGALRERAIANFMATWLPKRFDAQTNVFVSSAEGSDLELELDIVLYDSMLGAAWSLDVGGANSVVSIENIKLVCEVKSLLDDKKLASACKTMKRVSDFASDLGEKPVRILFAYHVKSETFDRLTDRFAEFSSDAYPFDAVFFLSGGAYFSSELYSTLIGFERGLGPDLALSDGPSQDRLTIQFGTETRYCNGFRSVGSGTPEETLFALATVVTLAAAGPQPTQAFLAACRGVNFSPMFPESDPDDVDFDFDPGFEDEEPFP